MKNEKPLLMKIDTKSAKNKSHLKNDKPQHQNKEKNNIFYLGVTKPSPVE